MKISVKSGVDNEILPKGDIFFPTVLPILGKQRYSSKKDAGEGRLDNFYRDGHWEEV